MVVGAGICLLLIVMICAFIVRHTEIKRYNKGRCRCGGNYKQFDIDSQGGIGWECDKCGGYIWTSWVKVK